MAFYRICPHCGAHLDPGETCDCYLEHEQAEAEKRKQETEQAKLFMMEKNGQLRMAV